MTMQKFSKMRRALVASVWIALVSVVAGCGTNDKLTTPQPGPANNGSADFTKYVAIGNSLTAGMQSAAVSKVFSGYSYPNLIAQQTGVATFVQPQIADPGIGQYTPQGFGRLNLVSLNPLVIQPIPLTTTPTNMLENALYAAPYNNLGIPGALAVEIPTATTKENSISHSDFFDLVLRNPAFGNTTVLQQALMLKPTFVTVWLGANDVLGYATSGGTQAGLPSPAAAVEAAIGMIVSGVRATGANVAIANLPDVAAAPFFTTLKPYLTDPSTGTPILVSGNKIHLLGPGGAQLTSADMVLLTAKDSLAVGTGIPPGIPGVTSSGRVLQDKLVLSASEQATAQNAVDAYNQAIARIAAANNCALVDINALFKDILAHGYQVGGVKLGSAMITGGLISLDGVHPTSVGQAIIANEFIMAINEKFNATIPLVNVAQMLGH